jgi:NUDIX domain
MPRSINVVRHRDSSGIITYLIVETGERQKIRVSGRFIDAPRITRAEFDSGKFTYNGSVYDVSSMAFFKTSTTGLSTSRIYVPRIPPTWGFIKGGIESSEEFNVAAARELFEESGLDLRSDLERFIFIGNIEGANPVFGIDITDEERIIIEDILDNRISKKEGEIFNYKFIAYENLCLMKLNKQSMLVCAAPYKGGRSKKTIKKKRSYSGK